MKKRPQCLAAGIALTRVECGLSLAARGLQNGSHGDLSLGLSTARVSMAAVRSAGLDGSKTSGIVRRIGSINGLIQDKKKISPKDSKKILTAIYETMGGIRALHQDAARVCK